MMHDQVYLLTQKCLAHDARKNILSFIHKIAGSSLKGRVLDVGCGPQSLLKSLDINLACIDLDLNHIQRVIRDGEKGVVASAMNLPFKANTFDSVFSFGLLHHLNETAARVAISEMQRVTKPNGWTFIFDGVLPIKSGKHPFAWLIRKFDFGTMRREKEMNALFESVSDWKRKRLTYTQSGLEGIFYWKNGAL